MMTYYEELGVPGGASREEIRQAYKRLVRLLHPDRCGDPATRELAELQMRRLNGILEVLSDPGERAHYDRALAGRDSPGRHPAAAGDGPPQRPRPLWHNWWGARRWRGPAAAGGTPCAEPPERPAWWRNARWRRLAMWRLAAAVPGVLALLLFCTLMPSSPPVRKPAAQAAAQERQIALPAARRIESARSSPAAAIPAAAVEERDPPMEALAGYSPPPQDRPAEANPPQSPERTATDTPAASAPAAAEVPNALTGDWFFVPTSETRKSGYPPEFIELRLSEEQGVTRGRYRARYRVTDRAISPNVAFHFEGRTAAQGGVLPWRGAGGAQGEITLRLLPNGNLEVEWAAAQLGEELGLIAGTATLVRKLE